MTAPIDHVIWATSDIETDARRFLAEYGLAAVPGGRHPGHGTGNVIIPLGPDYIELITVVDGVSAAESPLGSLVARSIAAGGGWLGYAMRVEEIAPDDDPVAMSRILEDGSLLSWRIGRFSDFLGPARLPFVISWDAPADRLPGAADADHRIDVRGIDHVTVGGTGADTDQVRHVAGGPGLHQVSIATGHGHLTIG